MFCLTPCSLGFAEKGKVAVTTQAGGANQVLDHEHRDRIVCRDDKGSFHIRSGIDQVISGLTSESESFSFEDCNKLPVTDRTNGRPLMERERFVIE